MARLTLQDIHINDATNDIPTVGLKGSLDLRDRFKYRLGRMLGATVTVTEAEDPKTLNVYIAPKQGVVKPMVINDVTRRFVTDLQHALRGIACCSGEGEHNNQVGLQS